MTNLDGTGGILFRKTFFRCCPWYFFLFRVCIHITAFQTFAFSKISKNNFFVKKIIFLKKIGKNRKKYHSDDIKNFFLNKMPPVPSKSVKSYDLSLRQQNTHFQPPKILFFTFLTIILDMSIAFLRLLVLTQFFVCGGLIPIGSQNCKKLKI